MRDLTGGRPGASTALWLVLGIFIALVLLFHSTALSIAAIWYRSNTWGHGFVIPPIAGWLVWRKRERLAAIPLRPSLSWLPVLALLGFAWMWGRLAGVLILEQYSFALLIPATIATLLGWQVVRELLFPLCFMLLGVPAWDVIVPQLIDFTAVFTVRALTLSGVPVSRSGPFLTLPNGEWAIADACSGFRYLMASFTLGCLYAYLRLRTWKFRALFVAASAVLPIFANGLRAYVIVMLGYLSDMKIAVHADHIIYGWLLFVVFCAVLFWIGSLLREPPPAAEPGPSPRATAPPAHPARRIVVAGALGAVAIGIWPAYAARIEASPADRAAVRLALPEAAGGWRLTDEVVSDWKPHYSGAAVDTTVTYLRDGRLVSVYLAYYRHQVQGSELINAQNDIITLKTRLWRWDGEGERSIESEGRPRRVHETCLRGEGQNLLVWHRYWLRGRYTTNRYVAELLELKGRMMDGRDDAALVALYAPYGEHRETAAADLRAFLVDAGPSLDAALLRTAGDP